jgi:hypothetical protein
MEDLLVIIDDFDVMGIIIAPNEANSPASVDSDAVQPGQIALKLLEPVARRYPQIRDSRRIVKHSQFPQGRLLYRFRQLQRRQTIENPFRLSIFEGPDHGRI